MTITLITQENYETLLELQKRNPVFTFQNKGYEYIDKSKFTNEDKWALATINFILKHSIKGFSVFNNFLYSKDNELKIRFQYNWSADSEGISFIGVGYLFVDELLNGFREKEVVNDNI